MIEKWYEVTCDYCGGVLNHYIGRKPSTKELRSDGFICTDSNQFCSEECFENWRHNWQDKKKLKNL